MDNWLKRAVIAATVALALASAGSALAADIASLAWNASNIQTLRSFNKDAVVKFIDDWSGSAGTPDAVTSDEVRRFRWVDLAGNGKYELITLGSSGPCCVFLTIFEKNDAGKVTIQSFNGGGDLHKTIRDLNGDGKNEIILSKLVVENSGQLKFYWPAVYRLEDGKYVEASRDFPIFYDDQVLPKLNVEIAKARAAAKGEAGPEKPQVERAAGIVMERDKILRVLGRDPTAGLNHAYQWLNSDDPYLLQDAEVTFKEVGGHEAETRTAQAKRTHAFCQQNPDVAMCKNAPK